MTTQTLTRTPTPSAPNKAASAPVAGSDGLPIKLRFEPAIEMTDEQFAIFCELNKEVRIERTAEGAIELMPPTYSDTGAKELDVGADLKMWARSDGTGIAFGSSAGFTLPNGAMRSPDASWISSERLDALTPEEKGGFARVCPDFVIELRSRSDRLSVLQAKMEEYMANGAQLGWLLDPLERQAHVYRPGAQAEILDNPDSLSADPELPGFTLDLTRIWEPAY